MFAVTVTFKIRPASWNLFLPLMRQNAQTSLTEEAGCRQFDVCTDQARLGEVFLYEHYDSAAAFKLHLESEHFRAFDAAVADMIESKDVATFGIVE